MKVTDFDFDLPKTLIASRPTIPRDGCRLLVLHRDGLLEHRKFFNLTEYLAEGDLLLLNDTRVFPARLSGSKKTGGKVPLILVREIEPDVWEVLSRERYSGMVRLSHDLCGEMTKGKFITFIREDSSSDLMTILSRIGSMPLPPYIKRTPDESDRDHYQTVYAAETGSIAAPTAGLHFTKELIETLLKQGVMVRFLTLHVGTGTFRPITSDTVAGHAMAEEHFRIEKDLIETVGKVRASGKRVVSVGTTTTRALEGFVSGAYRRSNGVNGAYEGTTDIFIFPGYSFSAVNSLLTNFHLPKSTPLMLTAALSGTSKLLAAYKSAISKGYRFFSYGDAMLIL